MNTNEAPLLPGFTSKGLLPPGDYELTLEQLKASLLVLGPGEPQHYPTWDPVWRERLVDNLAILVGELWQVGVMGIFIDGSFVEDKDRPNDIDGYFVPEPVKLASGQLGRELNLLNEHKV